MNILPPNPSEDIQPSCPTMRQIAAEAGVTVATVSMALRDSPRIKAETRSNVQAVAKRLGYRPNPLVSVLMNHVRTTRSPLYHCTLAYIDFMSGEEGYQGSTYEAYFKGAVRRGEELGFKVERFTLSKRGISSSKLSVILHNRGIPGIIVGPMQFTQRHLQLEFKHMASVAIGYSLWKPDLHRVCNHQYRTALIAARELRRHGYKRVAVVISAEDNYRTYYSWEAGFRVAANHLSNKIEFIFFPDNILVPEDVLLWVEKINPDAVVALDPSVLRALANGPRKVPQQLGILDLDCLNSRHLGYSGVDQNSSLVGEASVELVTGQIQRNERGIPLHPKIVLVSGKWFEGKTLRSVVGNVSLETSPKARGKTLRKHDLLPAP